MELPPRSKATIFAEDVRGSGIPAARLDIGPNSLSLDCDSRRHGGHQTTGLRGEGTAFTLLAHHGPF